MNSLRSEFKFEAPWLVARKGTGPDRKIQEIEEGLDSLFFHHQPSGKFSVSEEIPAQIRKLMDEVDGCIRENYPVSAAGSLRKIVYRLLRNQGVPKTGKYEEQIDQLATLRPDVSSVVIEELKAVNDLASNQLHEDELTVDEALTMDKVKYLFQLIHEALYELYVVPHENKLRLTKLAQIKK